ncbi:hypothetical protein HXX02_17125 [Microbulbifer elongatus]|uniref:DUF6966 domain-containing protein n=2 Tax=Microbulbifer elongatus TaxID=86173 RepID=A0ABT1P4W4_9GAMM|nr:hypothetical protein [Microbulbifer elongatus]
MNHGSYRDNILEMITLLEEGGHEHWKRWFQKSLSLLEAGDCQKSFAHTISAYGGMGSFNDVFWNLPKEKFVRLEEIRGRAWSYAKEHRT